MKVSIIGASGAVGREFLKIIEKENSISEVELYANRSAGKFIKFRGKEHRLKSLDEFIDNSNIVFISATTSLSKKLGRQLSKNSYVIDDSSAFRLDEDVPLVVPEVNADELKKEKRLISIPNCTTTPLVMILKALEDFEIKSVFVVTFQSVSGAGGGAIDELNSQIYLDAAGIDYKTKFSKLPGPIHRNIIPHVDEIMEDGYTKEEKKIILETKKILKMPELNITAFCTRVPVVR
ncbi:MAG: Asd/ArgC dimerization domain-containing protein, partial [bacterium]|nr:Asd/ArgC dimerization domain-containing protein [bacterium]